LEFDILVFRLFPPLYFPYFVLNQIKRLNEMNPLPDKEEFFLFPSVLKKHKQKIVSIKSQTPGCFMCTILV